MQEVKLKLPDATYTKLLELAKNKQLDLLILDVLDKFLYEIESTESSTITETERTSPTHRE
jgi:hypothetical protein